MARKLLVSSRKIPQPVHPSKESALQSPSNDDEEEDLKLEQDQVATAATGTSSEEEFVKNDDHEHVPMVPMPTPRGKQLRLNIQNIHEEEEDEREKDARSSASSSSSESYASIQSSEGELDEEFQPSKKSSKTESKSKSTTSKTKTKTKIKTDMKSSPAQVVVKSSRSPSRGNIVVTASKSKSNLKIRPRPRVECDDQYPMADAVQNRLLNFAQSTTSDTSDRKAKKIKPSPANTAMKSAEERNQFATALTQRLEKITSPSSLPSSSTALAKEETERASTVESSKARTQNKIQPRAKIIKRTPADWAKMDPMLLRKQSEKLMEEARKLKHQGDRMDKAQALKKGHCYLNSSLKFFQYATILGDVKSIYRAKGDDHRAKQFGEGSLRVLPTTASLIEVAARSFTTAKEVPFAAIRYVENFGYCGIRLY